MLMYLYSVLAIIATSLNVVVLISSKQNQEVVKSLEWSHGDQENCVGNYCYDIYVGVYNMIVDYGDSVNEIKWTDDECIADFCHDCAYTMQGVIAFAAAACVFSFPLIFTNFSRAGITGNTHSRRMSSVLLSLFSTLCGLFSVIWFYSGCQQKIEKESNSNFEWALGTAWILMVVATGMYAVNFVGNLSFPSRMIE